jgi:hypothetical protein
VWMSNGYFHYIGGTPGSTRILEGDTNIVKIYNLL